MGSDLMTQSNEAEILIKEHLAWLQPRVRSAHTEGDPPTIISRRRCLRHADRNLPHGLLDREVGDHIDTYLSQWKEGWSRYTYWTHLKGFYAWGVAARRLLFDPMAKLARPAKGHDVPNPPKDWELAIALGAPAPYGAAAHLAAYMGLRAGEIVRADRAHVVGSMLRVRGKGGRTRTVPISPEVEHIVAAAAGRLIGRTIRESTLTGRQRQVWLDLGLHDMHLHRFRDWYATRLLESGALITEVARLLGHASVETTARSYLQVVDERLVAAVTRLPPAAMLQVGTGRLDPGPSPSPASSAA